MLNERCLNVKMEVGSWGRTLETTLFLAAKWSQVQYHLILSLVARNLTRKQFIFYSLAEKTRKVLLS